MEHIGESLNTYLRNTGLKKQLEKQNLLNTWYNVVGKHISRYTRPITIRENKLIVEVKDSSWMHHLTLLKPKILVDFNEAVGENVIVDVQFKNSDFQTEKDNKKNSNKKEEVNNRTGRIPFQGGTKIFLSAVEEKEIDQFLINTPETLQSTLKSLIQKSFIYQQWKKEQGALNCSICGFPHFEHELKGRHCFLCDSQVVSWKKPVQYALHQRPWINYDEIRFIFPSLEVKIFNICRDLILNRYAERIRKLFFRPDIDENIKKKGLRRLVQRYVLILEEKEPSQVTQENIYKALKSFPGLYMFLFNNDETVT